MLLKEQGYRLQTNRKTKERKQEADAKAVLFKRLYGVNPDTFDKMVSIETRKIENILLELSKRITATHRQYAGEYAYQNIEIIYDNKNEYDPNEIEGPKGITITCTDTGNLRALFKFDSPRDDYEYDFFIYDNSKNEIEYSYWDGHAASGSTKYYIENDYIINHFENSTGYSEEESGYTVAYKIYYKKRTNRS